MLKEIRRQIILEPTELAFEADGVLNPAIFYENGITHLFYRAVQVGNYSSVGYAILKDDQVIYRSMEPILRPVGAFESHGLEDPRIVKIKNIFYLFYTVYDGTDAQIAFATSKQLPNFTKQSIISSPLSYHDLLEMCKSGQLSDDFCKNTNWDHPEHVIIWDKDAFIFPEFYHGKLIIVHRLWPEIQLLYVNSFRQLDRRYWTKYMGKLENRTLLKRQYWFESAYIGGGVPPIKTPAGWLFIYHAVQKGENGQTYRGAAALLSYDDPSKVIGRLSYPLFSPEYDWEKNGVVDNVVFPTGAAIEGDRLKIYYGAADKRIGMIEFYLNDLLNELLNSPVIS
jgi:predicted GH43/DUF377 family glycosyl hydrolase